MDLKPLGDRVIVEVLDEEEVTYSGIVLPDTAKEKPQRGKVLAVGPGRYEDGKLVPLDVKKNDEIIFSKYGGTEVKLSGRRVPDPARVRHPGQGRHQQGRRKGVGGAPEWHTRN